VNEAERVTRLQILAIENATLLQHRSQVWSDASSRATIFLALLSGSVVALALGAQATTFDWRFFAFAVVLLPVVLYVGLISLGRLAELNNDDLLIVQKLHRIRHGILELDPGAEPYLAVSSFDDWAALSRTYAQTDELTGSAGITHGLRTLPALFAVVNCVVASALAASLAILIGVSGVVLVVLTVAVFAFLFAVQLRTAIRTIRALQGAMEVRYPSPSGAAAESAAAAQEDAAIAG
jgi:hypothetical protein